MAGVDGGGLSDAGRGQAVIRAGVARWVAHPVTGTACRLVLGGLFLYTGAVKLGHPAELARLINGYRILHPELANLAGIALPWVELLSGALLVLGIVPASAAMVAAGLLVVFMGAGFLALVRGLSIACGCFFPFLGGDRLSWALFPRDGALLVLALQVMWCGGETASTQRRGGRKGAQRTAALGLGTEVPRQRPETAASGGEKAEREQG